MLIFPTFHTSVCCGFSQFDLSRKGEGHTSHTGVNTDTTARDKTLPLTLAAEDCST